VAPSKLVGDQESGTKQVVAATLKPRKELERALNPMKWLTFQ
jgi:hypothetical protein